MSARQPPLRPSRTLPGSPPPAAEEQRHPVTDRLLRGCHEEEGDWPEEERHGLNDEIEARALPQQRAEKEDARRPQVVQVDATSHVCRVELQVVSIRQDGQLPLRKDAR